ncbi:HD domain-containing protein [Nocardioides terrisoli]|uniref:HD domain-containing protein n=1 Tax=Nocardioides terrisoli TaxID=3388267 RepID=UPI00287B5DB3|nr:HD domain-containing protein [Nocardioides marmorisolisilvae]
MTSVERARALAEGLLADVLPVRWTHVQAVAASANGVADDLGLDVETLVAAAWLHDVGYAPGVVQTGLHALDGARFLQGRDVEQRVVTLVARHSCAPVEARLRGLLDQLEGEFPELDQDLADALCYADMTTGPTGDRVEVEDRLAEIRKRYGPDDVVTHFIDEAEAEIVATVRRVDQRR